MRFSILGSLRAEADDGSPLTPMRPAQRSTLAVLLLRGSQPATKAFLIEALWGDNRPGDADTALRVRMRDVRRVLGGHDRLRTHHLGYQMIVEPGELDADSFRALIARGRAALDSGDTQDAARLLEQACRLWEDPPLTDLPDTPLMRMAATSLLEQRRDAQEWLIDARLALGQHHVALTHIRAVIAADPLHEHSHVQLMLALYRCGQKAAALNAYARLRALTVREFGQDPGPEAREMLGQILSDSPQLRFRSTALTAGLDSRPAWIPVCQLPAPPPDFTGRAAAIEAIARHMPAATMAVTVITGPPGAGKSALAVNAAHLARNAFPDGQLYVSLGGLGAPREALDALGELVRSLGVPATRVPADIAERAALYRSILAGRRVLVLADDAASAAQVRPLLPGTQGSAAIVTSSLRLVDLEGAHSLAIAELSDEESLALLDKVAGGDRVAGEPEEAAAITAACARLPLALRIAGARLSAGQTARLADLAAALSDPDKLLDELVIGDLSVRRRLDVAWQALDVNSRRVLAALARSGAQRLADSRVLAAASDEAAVVHALANSCLLIQDSETGLYRLAPLVGRYAAAQNV